VELPKETSGTIPHPAYRRACWFPKKHHMGVAVNGGRNLEPQFYRRALVPVYRKRPIARGGGSIMVNNF